MSISSEDDTDSTAKLDSEYDSEDYADVDMNMEDDVDSPDGCDLDCDVDMGRNGGDDEEEDEEKEDEEKEDVEEVEEEEGDEDEEGYEDEEEDEDEDDGKEPRTIGLGEMVNTSADDADTMVDDEPTVLPEPHQEMREDTPEPQPLAPAARPQAQEPHPRPRTEETHTVNVLDLLGLVTPQQPHPVAPTLRETDVDGATLDVDVDQQI
jgi:hypothetical protein